VLLSVVQDGPIGTAYWEDRTFGRGYWSLLRITRHAGHQRVECKEGPGYFRLYADILISMSAIAAEMSHAGDFVFVLPGLPA
jgi:hypothetical protein